MIERKSRLDYAAVCSPMAQNRLDNTEEYFCRYMHLI